VDLHQLWEDPEPSHTWKNSMSSSRIDYIWSSMAVANNILQLQNCSFVEVTNSDHTLLDFKITRSILLHTPPTHATQHVKAKHRYEKIIDVNKTNNEQWDKYKAKIESKILKIKLPERVAALQQDNNIENAIQIQEVWEDFEKIIIATAFNNLYCEKKGPRRHTNTCNATKNVKEKNLIKIYKNLHKIIKKFENEDLVLTPLSLIHQLNTWISRASEILADNPQASSELETLNTYIIDNNTTHIIEQMQIFKTILKKICIQEERKRTNQEIQEAIEARCRDLKINQRRIVQTLTNNFKDKITIDRIKIVDTNDREYITIDKEEIIHQTELYY
jgi:hypothetical protein